MNHVIREPDGSYTTKHAGNAIFNGTQEQAWRVAEDKPVHSTKGELARAYKAACYVISKEQECGLIDYREASRRMGEKFREMFGTATVDFS